MKRLLLPLVLAVAVGALSFLIARALIGDDADPGVDTAAGEPMVVVVAVPFEGDPREAAAALVEDEIAGREAASAEGVVLGDAEIVVESFSAPGGGSGFSDEEPDPGAPPPAGDAGDPVPGGGFSFPDEEPDLEAPLPTGDVGDDGPPFGGVGSGGAGTPDDRAVDLCAEPEAPDGCPDGVGGFILLAIEGLPPYEGAVSMEPYPPGGAPTIRHAECERLTPELGTVQLGLTANRPSDITVTIQQWFDDESLGEDIAVSVSSSEAQEAAWLAWREDEAPEGDPRSWIRHCLVFTGLPEGVYIGRAEFTDRFGGDALDLPEDSPYFSFLVAEPSDTGPVQTRRPTRLSGLFVDLLYVSVTRDPAQRVIGRAVAAGESCDPGGDIDSLYRSAPGVIQARVTGDVEIPAERLGSPDYPYWPSHSRSVGMLLALEEGTDYTLCLYWVNESGPAFATRSIVLTEQIPVSTPSAYRPRITVTGINDDLGAIKAGTATDVVVSGRHFFPECRRTFTRFDNAIPNRLGNWFQLDEPLCAPQSGLWDVVNRGAMIIDTEVVFEGERHYRGAYLRMDLLCPTSPCPPRPPESALIPLPGVVTERRLCGSGWGGCSGDSPERRLGVVALTIDYDRTPGNGATSWQIGEPGGFTVTPAPLPTEPRLAVKIVDRPPPPFTRSDGATIDAGLEITVQADRAVSWTAIVEPVGSDGDPICLVGPHPEPHSANSPAAPGLRPAPVIFRLSGLCVGSAYTITFTGSDGEGCSTSRWWSGATNLAARPSRRTALWMTRWPATEHSPCPSWRAASGEDGAPGELVLRRRSTSRRRIRRSLEDAT
jgi:hypothetical protein